MTWKSSCSQKVIFVKIKLKYPAFPHFITDLEKYVFKKLLGKNRYTEDLCRSCNDLEVFVFSEGDLC